MIKKITHSIMTMVLIIIACGMIVVCMQRPPIGGAEGTSLETGIFPVCENGYDQSHPVIHGDRIVWMDERESRYSDDLYMYDISSETESMFSNIPNAQYYPDIYENTVVWQCSNDSFEDQILMKSLGGDMKNISWIPDESEDNPLIDGDWVVWSYTFYEEGDWGLDYGLVSYQISTGITEIEQVTFDSKNDLDLSNGRIAWLDMMGTEDLLGARLYIYNIITNTMELEMDVGWLDVCLTGDIITYFNLNIFEGYELREMNLLTRQVTRFYYMEEPPSEIERYGDFIVWSDPRNDETEGYFPENLDIYLFDTRNRVETQITSNSKTQDNPAIHGNIVVWEDERNGNPDIFGYNLTKDMNGNGIPDYLDFGKKKELKEDDIGDQEIWFAICLLGSCTLVACIIIIGLVMFFKRKNVPQTLPFIQQPMAQYPPPMPQYQTPMGGNIQPEYPMYSQTINLQTNQVPNVNIVEQQLQQQGFSQHQQEFGQNQYEFPQQPGQQQPYPPHPVNFCGICGQPVHFDPHSNRNYCNNCQRYQ